MTAPIYQTEEAPLKVPPSWLAAVIALSFVSAGNTHAEKLIDLTHPADPLSTMSAAQRDWRMAGACCCREP